MSNEKNNAAPDPKPAELAEQQGDHVPDAILRCAIRAFERARKDYKLRLCNEEPQGKKEAIEALSMETALQAAFALAATGKQQVAKKEHWLDRMAAIEGRIEPSVREMEGMDEVQIGEVQGDALYIEWLKERISSIYSTVSLGHQTGPYAYAGEDFSRYLTEAASDCRKIMRVLSALAARQPGAQEPVAYQARGIFDGVVGNWHAISEVEYKHFTPFPTRTYEVRALYAAPPAQGIDLGLIVRECCEAEVADPDHEATICISVSDLTAIIAQHSQRDAAPGVGNG